MAVCPTDKADFWSNKNPIIKHKNLNFMPLQSYMENMDLFFSCVFVSLLIGVFRHQRTDKEWELVKVSQA